MNETTNAYGVLRLDEYKQFVEKKGKFDYLSWAVAWDKVKCTFPYARYKAREYNVTIGGNTLTLPYMVLPNQTAMVKVDLWLTDVEGDEHEGTMELAVRDNRNNAVTDPDSAQVENAIRRCLAKAVSAMTGFGIELWFGEDIKGLDYTKPTHLNGAEIKVGNATQDQTIKLDTLMRDRNCPKPNKLDIQTAKDGGFNITEEHAALMIADAKEGIKQNKPATQTAKDKVIKILQGMDYDEKKRSQLVEWVNGKISTKELTEFQTKLTNKGKS
tara:strand:- start:193 stop:1005 length:813 start_codon:yes stop_codon:yes gene_type:complete